jgi:type I pullulanase
MSSTLKRAIGFLISLLMSFGIVAASASTASALPEKVTLTVHYNRTAGDYEGWNVYLWRNVDTGTDKEVKADGIAFTASDDFGQVATVEVDGMANFKDLGFIIRKGNWVKKEGASCGPTKNGDRFASFDNTGITEIWIKQDDCTIYTEAPTVEAPAPAIVGASIDDLKKITVVLNQQFTLGAGANGFTVSGGLTVASVALKGGNGTSSSMLTLTLSDEIEFGTTYTVTHTGPDADRTFGSKVASVGNVMNSAGFNNAFNYTGDDLGNTYTKQATSFRVWAPTATSVKLATFASATSASAAATEIPMTQDVKGTWVATLNGDQNGTIYAYRVTRNGETVSVIDPYVRASTVNGGRGVVVDLDSTDPSGWSSPRPAFSGRNVDAFFYELHVRDFSINASSGISTKNRGKFMAFTENNTSYSWSVTTTDSKTKKKVTKKYSTKTGISAIKDLGVTHVQLLPMYDYASGGDESNPIFNWGYDPDNFNVPEGQYSTKPTVPTNRINELKQAVKAMHSNKLRVVMDVVYNHVANPNNFSFEQIVPGYFFRTDDTGALLNGTGVGNETASERPMVSKFIVDSVKYWATEYKLDGFRFDLMGIHDVDTMVKVREELDKIDPSIIIIGEGWNMGALPEDQRATQINIAKMDGIAAFNDQIRDGVKGSVFNADEKGWATGNTGRRGDVVAGITGNVAYSASVTGAWVTNDPGQSVSYVEAHDNLTLADKLTASVSGTPATRSKLHRFSSSIALLAQGLPFIHAGQEFERTKNGDDNSYQSSDAVNSMKYKQRVTYATTLNYFKGLIALRKAHPAFRMATTADIKKNLTFLNTSSTVIAYRLNGAAVGDKWANIVVIHNAGKTTASVTMPGGKATWKVVVNGDRAGVSTIATLKSVTKVSVPAGTTMVLYK